MLLVAQYGMVRTGPTFCQHWIRWSCILMSIYPYITGFSMWIIKSIAIGINPYIILLIILCIIMLINPYITLLIIQCIIMMINPYITLLIILCVIILINLCVIMQIKQHITILNNF